MKRFGLLVGCLLLVGSVAWTQRPEARSPAAVTLRAKTATVQLLREGRQYHCRIVADGVDLEVKDIPPHSIIPGQPLTPGLIQGSGGVTVRDETVQRNGRSVRRTISRGTEESRAFLSLQFPHYPALSLQAVEIIVERWPA